MDAKTVVFKKISCGTAGKLIKKSTTGVTDRITWGRLLRHLRECPTCKQLFIDHHQERIADIAKEVINLEVLAEHRHYALADVGMHFTKGQLEQYPGGGLTKIERALIAKHITTCHDCKSKIPSA